MKYKYIDKQKTLRGGGLKISGVKIICYVGHSLNFYKFVAFSGRKCFYGDKKLKLGNEYK